MTLKIYLLGQFNLQADELSIGLPSRPAQSLLAYLAMNAGVAHRREMLASLLWPDSTESNARSYLRQAIWRIRKSLEDNSIQWEDYLQISDISVSFNAQSDHWMDVELLLKPAHTWSTEEIEESVRLYRGDLLPGFYEEWILSERDRLQAAYHQKMHLFLTRLHESERWRDVLKWGEQWIRLGHSPEEAFRALMTAHAQLGDHGMVSATYQRCIDALDRELSLDPSPETRKLYERIIRGEVEDPGPPPTIVTEPSGKQPSFLDDQEPEKYEKTVFVARERELLQLEEFLKLALSGKGRVVFLTGEAGSGKTTLIRDLTRRALEIHPDLIIASGNCNAHTGVGDPYLPFREILGLLTGDVEALWAGGTIPKELARRLWNTLPLTAQALVEYGSDLIGTFIPGTALVNRVMTYAPQETNWLTQLKELAGRKDLPLVVRGTRQIDLFEQYSRVLRVLSLETPLVLVLDSMQWADTGSVGLLFHLGRQLAGSSILIVGAYRQEEVTLGREGDRHPLEPVVNEFQREFGSITVSLEQADRRRFVEDLLDSEPNCLGPAFRDKLHRQTNGHPLFTIELLRGMQDRGDLMRNPESMWVEGSTLDWETMPARVEAVIAERISRLAYPLQVMLRTACIEGEVFTAEVLAQIIKIEESELLAQLSGELDRRHRLIRAESIQRLGGQFLSSYRFRHILFQKYLYSSLDEVERVHLHEQIGSALEGLYSVQEEIPVVALQLARHFEEAGMPEKAIYYLHQAGERAIHLSAYEEGISHLRRGLELLSQVQDRSKRDQYELMLQLAIGMAWKYNWASPQGRNAINRARELSQQLGKTDHLSRVLVELAIYHYVHAEYHHAIVVASGALSLAEQENDPLLVAEGNWSLGFLKFCLGDYTNARTHLEHVIAFYNPEQHHRSLVFLRGVDVGLSAMAYNACCLWCLGYPDQAMKISKEAIALAKGYNHPFTLADVLCYAGCMFNAMLRNTPTLEDCAESLLEIATSEGLYMSGWYGMASNFKGVALTMQEQAQKGMEYIQECITSTQTSGVRLYNIISLQSLAKAQAETGDTEAALVTIREAMVQLEQTDDRHWEAELHRLKAELLIAEGDDSNAESSFAKALEVSRKQQAKSWELRASIGLAHLWQKQDKLEEARTLLETIYNWFTEGFDSPDLKEAKALLDDLTCNHED